jgi:CubicO group peptidase (beta-lactamase class C family)
MTPSRGPIASLTRACYFKLETGPTYASGGHVPTRFLTSVLLIVSLVRLAGAQQEPPKRVAQARPVATSASEIPPTTAPAARGLRDRAEMEAFMDGVMTAQLRDHHVAGATVSVVKDGQLFFAKGYGSADVRKGTAVSGDSTLFRIGSISKLFTWTAVMQLVEQGKLDLNTDINKYLDFKIPETYPQPITLTHVMTHTPGFEEDPRDLFTEDSTHITPMGKWLPAHMPKRVRPPGTYASYSNWATATAGYIVQRVSGMSFDEYVEKNILEPLGMTQTSSRQPLPARYANAMSNGYQWKGGAFEPHKWEIITGAWPAGSVSSTATDMARFMIAHLNDGEYNGKRILSAETAEKMHTRAFSHDPRLNGFALGFYEKSSHGLRIIGHGGDTQWFHSDLALIPSEKVGVFVSYNTDTGSQLSFSPFLAQFLDHYYPEPRPAVVSKATKEQLQKFAGAYTANRMSYSTFFKIAALASATNISVADSGMLTANIAGQTWRLTPVDSLLFRDINTGEPVAFKQENGKITHAFIGMIPMETLERRSGLGAPMVHISVLVLGLVVFLLTVGAAIVRRFTPKQRRPGALPGRILVVGLSLAFLIGAAAIAGSIAGVQDLLYNRLGKLEFALALPVIGALLTLLALAAAVWQWLSGTGTKWERLRYTAVVAVAIAFVWSLNTWNLLGWRL